MSLNHRLPRVACSLLEYTSIETGFSSNSCSVFNNVWLSLLSFWLYLVGTTDLLRLCYAYHADTINTDNVVKELLDSCMVGRRILLDLDEPVVHYAGFFIKDEWCRFTLSTWKPNCPCSELCAPPMVRKQITEPKRARFKGPSASAGKKTYADP